MKKIFVPLFIFHVSFFTYISAQSPILYGLTEYGGATNYGAIISFNPANGKESLVWSFGNGIDGKKPFGELIFDSSKGVFYGMSELGGAFFNGAVFSFNP